MSNVENRSFIEKYWVWILVIGCASIAMFSFSYAVSSGADQIAEVIEMDCDTLLAEIKDKHTTTYNTWLVDEWITKDCWVR